jgi:hypothetical protein
MHALGRSVGLIQDPGHNSSVLGHENENRAGYCILSLLVFAWNLNPAPVKPPRVEPATLVTGY